jgi:hypothetical protein
MLFEFDPRLVSMSAIEIMMMTAAQETHLGRWLWQDDGDPDVEPHLAMGIFQMEHAAYADAVRKIKERNPGMRSEYRPRTDLITDLRWAILCCRHFYLCCPRPFPDHTDIKALAKYYKAWWNRSPGAATIDAAIQNYKQYARREMR